MADTDADTDTAHRLAEIRARADAAHILMAKADVVYLLDLVATRDRELAELRGLLADLCEDSRAAAAAVRYRDALGRIRLLLARDPPPRDHVDEAWEIACVALEGETR